MTALYFVMLKHPNGSPVPLTDEDDNVCLYTSEKAAGIGANSSALGANCGYQIYKWNKT